MGRNEIIVTCPHCKVNVDIYHDWSAAGYCNGCWSTPMNFDAICTGCEKVFYVTAEDVGLNEIDYRTYSIIINKERHYTHEG